jgi:hypothetical protein
MAKTASRKSVVGTAKAFVGEIPIQPNVNITPISVSTYPRGTPQYYEKSIAVSATGVKTTMFQVPANKTWILVGASIVSDLTGTYTTNLSQIAIGRNVGGPAIGLLASTANVGPAATYGQFFTAPSNLIVLKAGDYIPFSIAVNAWTVAGNLLCDIMVLEFNGDITLN